MYVDNACYTCNAYGANAMQPLLSSPFHPFPSSIVQDGNGGVGSGCVEKEERRQRQRRDIKGQRQFGMPKGGKVNQVDEEEEKRPGNSMRKNTKMKKPELFTSTRRTCQRAAAVLIA